MVKGNLDTNLCVGDHQPARRQNEGNKRSCEKHLYDRNVALLLLIDLAERIAVVYSVSSAGTNGQTREVLVEGDEIHSGEAEASGDSVGVSNCGAAIAGLYL